MDDEARRKKLDEAVKKGMLQIAASKKEREVLENELSGLAMQKKKT